MISAFILSCLWLVINFSQSKECGHSEGYNHIYNIQKVLKDLLKIQII